METWRNQPSSCLPKSPPSSTEPLCLQPLPPSAQSGASLPYASSSWSQSWPVSMGELIRDKVKNTTHYGPS